MNGIIDTYRMAALIYTREPFLLQDVAKDFGWTLRRVIAHVQRAGSVLGVDHGCGFSYRGAPGRGTGAAAPGLALYKLAAVVIPFARASGGFTARDLSEVSGISYPGQIHRHIRALSAHFPVTEDVGARRSWGREGAPPAWYKWG